MKRNLTILTCATLLTGLAGSQAADEPAKAPDKPAPVLTDADRQSAEAQYLVPSPGDILGALQHLKIDWKALAGEVGKTEADAKDTYATRSQQALNLGIRVADAFVAVEAKDKDLFASASSVVLKLGNELTSNAGLSAKGEQARKLVDDGQWSKLGTLLEEMRLDVLTNLKGAHDENSITLASVGGWLRGLDLAAEFLSKSYTADGSKILRQAALVDYLDSRLQKLEAPASTSKEVALIKAQLPEIGALCRFDTTATLSQDKVQRLHKITSELVSALQK